MIDGNPKWTSTDGREWIQADNSEPVTPLPLLTAGAVSLEGGDFYHEVIASKLILSGDGVKWYECVLPLNGERIDSVTYFGGNLFAYVSSGSFTERIPSVLRSADGVAWQRVPGVHTVNLFDVRVNGARLGANGRTYNPYKESFFVSVDGINWVDTNTPYKAVPSQRC